MKKILNYTIVIIFALILVISKRCYEKENRVIYIKLNYIGKVKVERLPEVEWRVASIPQDGIIKDYNLKLPKNNFKENNLIISVRKRIKQVTYTKGKYIEQYKEHPYIGNAQFYKKVYPNTIFIYRIPKISIVEPTRE